MPDNNNNPFSIYVPQCQHHVGSNHVHWFPHDPMLHTRKNRVSKISAFEGSRSFLRRRLCPIMFERILDVSRETRSRGPAKRKYSICFHSSFKLQGYAGCVWEAKIYENLQHVARTAYLNSEWSMPSMDIDGIDAESVLRHSWTDLVECFAGK